MNGETQQEHAARVRLDTAVRALGRLEAAAEAVAHADSDCEAPEAVREALATVRREVKAARAEYRAALAAYVLAARAEGGAS